MNTVEVTEHQKALDIAKIRLMARKEVIFFTTVLFSLVHIWDEEIQTACTNGKYIRYNPTFFLSLDLEERIFLLLHETLHVALLHMVRIGNRNHAYWNMAADYVINAFLIKHGFKMPKMGLYDPRFDDMGVEEVYKILVDEAPKIDIPWDDLIEGDKKDPDNNPEKVQQEIEKILIHAQIQALTAGAGIGNLPGDLQVYLDRLLNPKLPWYTILRKFFNQYSKTDYSYSKPNRRYFPDWFLPSQHSTSLSEFAMFADASGSVSDTEFSQIISETSSIFRILKPPKITIGEFDTTIKKISVVKNLRELLSMQFHGRGGTLIEPVLEWAIENKPKLLLIFTDGGFKFHNPGIVPKNSQIIWLIHNNPKFNAPFGKVIHYEIETQ